MDNRPAAAALGDDMLVVYSGDSRNRTQDRDQDDLYTAVLKPTGKAQTPQFIDDAPSPAAEVETVHPNEAEDVARMRSFRLKTDDGQELRLVRGEFHRHTEYSAHRDQDGLLEDCCVMPRRRPTGLAGQRRPRQRLRPAVCLVDIQKTMDIYHNPPWFIAAVHLRAERRLSQRAPQRDLRPARHPHAAPRRHEGRREDRHARHQDAVRLPEALRRHLRQPHQRHRHGHRLARQRPAGRAGRGDLPGRPQQLRDAKAHPRLRADARRAAASDELSIPRASSGTPWPRATGWASRAPATTSARTPAMPCCWSRSPAARRSSRPSAPAAACRHRQHRAGRPLAAIT